MADLLRFIPVRQESLARIRARIAADINAGVDPESPAWVDLTPGSIPDDILGALALEIEKLWDVATVDVPAAAFVEFAWGPYLDAHGATINVPRKAAVAATGELTFSGTDGTMIPAGSEASVPQTDPEVEPPSFRTTVGGTIAGGTLTVAAIAVDPGPEGNVAAAAITSVDAALGGGVTVTNAATFTGGADPESDEAYRARLKLEFASAQGAGSIGDYKRWALAHPSVGHVRVIPLWLGPGSVRLVVTDVNNDPVSTEVRDELQNQIDPYQASTKLNGSHTLPDATIDVDDASLFYSSGRVLIGGTQEITYTGKSGNTLTGCTGGSGVVPDDTSVVQGGVGLGLAPVGAFVTVSTPATLVVNVAANVDWDDGYSADGADGTIGLQSQIEDALSAYVDALGPGGEDPPGGESPAGSGEVLLNRVESRFFAVDGVYDVTGVTLNTVAADLAVGALQVPALGSVTLT